MHQSVRGLRLTLNVHIVIVENIAMVVSLFNFTLILMAALIRRTVSTRNYLTIFTVYLDCTDCYNEQILKGQILWQSENDACV